MDPTIDPASKALTLPSGGFNVWPTKEQRKEARQRGRNMLSELGIADMEHTYNYSYSSEDYSEDIYSDDSEDVDDSGDEDHEEEN